MLDHEKKDELEGLEERILVNPFPVNAPAPAHPMLYRLNEALVQHRVILADYFSNYKGEFTTRQVEPIGLIFYHNHWHLIGFCRMRQDYRDFRTDRLTNLQLLKERYKPFQHLSLQEYIDGLTRKTDLQRIEIRVHKSIVRFMADSKYQMGLVQEQEEGEYQRMVFTFMGLDYFARWILMMLDKVEVVSPPELKEKLNRFVGLLEHHHSQESD